MEDRPRAQERLRGPEEGLDLEQHREAHGNADLELGNGSVGVRGLIVAPLRSRRLDSGVWCRDPN